MTKTLYHYVNGKRVPGESDRYGDVFNPSLGQVQAQVPLASRAETESAVAAAKAALPEWSATPPLRRARVILRFLELLNQYQEDLAVLIASEHGKVLSDARGSVVRGIEVVEFVCGIPQLLKGEYAESVGTDVDSHCVRQALGVCVGITPFNFPAMVPMWMFPVAIACGNTFVLKTS